MMKPKVALVKDGFLPPGSENKRGRLSADAIERCKVLVTQGWKIEGYTMSHEPIPTETAGAAAAQVKKSAASASGKEIADIGEPIRAEEAWEAYANVNGVITDIGMRTVCNTCHNSLTYCWCRSPIVNLDDDASGVVNFKPRTTPLQAKRW